MAKFHACFIEGLLAFQICVVLMVGSFDSTNSTAVGSLQPDAALGFKPPMKPMPPMAPRRARDPIAVEGVVFCKSCKFRGVDTLLGAGLLPEAVVRLKCNSSRRVIVVEGKTDKNGYYFMQPRRVTTFAAHKCKVFLVSSPLKKCTQPTDLNGGVRGASLRFRKELGGPTPVALFSVQPLAFAPTKTQCSHSP